MMLSVWRCYRAHFARFHRRSRRHWWWEYCRGVLIWKSSVDKVCFHRKTYLISGMNRSICAIVVTSRPSASICSCLIQPSALMCCFQDVITLSKFPLRLSSQYTTTKEAFASRAALHGVKWPQSNPKVLSVEFCEQAEVITHQRRGGSWSLKLQVLNHR